MHISMFNSYPPSWVGLLGSRESFEQPMVANRGFGAHQAVLDGAHLSFFSIRFTAGVQTLPGESCKALTAA
jgi:hypothetical protein